MVNDKLHLRGSKTRDNFKFWHKELRHRFAIASRFYASDIDFVLVEKLPYPRIVAVLDYKAERENIHPSFSEVITYNDFLDLAIPVFIVQSDDRFTWFNIWRYAGGDSKPSPPVCTLTPVLMRGTVNDFVDWEEMLRQFEPEVTP